MASYDSATGWTWLPSNEWMGWFRPVEGSSINHFTRLDESGIDWYLDRGFGLNGRCDPERLSVLLSGTPRAPWEPPPENPEKQWLTLRDLAMALTRDTSAPETALKWLRAAGLLVREDGRDVPTVAARGLYRERPMKGAYGRPRPGVMQLWAFEVLRVLNALPEADRPRKMLDHPEEWKTGGEPMTDKQKEFYKGLCLDRDEPYDDTLSKAAAAARITELKGKPIVPMTPELAAQLKELCDAAGLHFNPGLSRGAAAAKIEKLVARASARAQALDAGAQVKRARLTRDVLSAVGSTHQRGTEVVFLEERRAKPGFCLIEVAIRDESLEDRYVILEVEAAALERLPAVAVDHADGVGA